MPTRSFLCRILFVLGIVTSDLDQWTWISNYSQDYIGNPFLLPSDPFEWLLGDPTFVDISGSRFVFANEVFHGILSYRLDPDSSAEEFKYKKLGAAVGKPGAVRPYCHVEDGILYLFWEQYTLRSFYGNSRMMMKTGRVKEDGELEWNKDEVVVLEPELDWETEGSERVGNPFVFFHEKDETYYLYYSASSQVLPDSKVAEPIFLGLATSDNLWGPWTRVSDMPMVVNGLNIEGEETMGIGSLKLVKGIDQNYDHLVGLINRVTKNSKTGATGSTISMVESTDFGLTWNTVEPHLITPTLVENDWKEAYVYGFDTGLDLDDDEYILVMYNARDGWAHAKETVGATRIKKGMFVT